MTKKIIGYKNYEVKILQMAFFNTLWFLNLYGLDFFRPSFWVGTPTHFGIFIYPNAIWTYATAAKASSSVLIAILNMFLFVGMNLLESSVTGPAYNDQNI